MSIIPIRPKRPIVNPEAMLRALTQGLNDTLADGQAWIAAYPPQTLRKTGYVRTGTLKRSWANDAGVSHKAVQIGGTLEGVVGSNSNIAPYNTYVEGPKQSRLMAGAGWRNTTELVKYMEKRLAKNIQTQVEKAVRA